MGFKLGIGGVVTFKNSNLPQTLSKINIENILLETDSPYLSPAPLRGTINEPLNLNIIEKKIFLMEEFIKGNLLMVQQYII